MRFFTQPGRLTSSLPAAFFAITLALLLHGPISTGSHHGAAQRHLQHRFEEVFHRFSPLVTSHATLGHGEDCVSPYEEKLRQQIMEELHLMATSHATLGRVKDAIKKMEEFISMNDKELCNYRLSLVCDEETRKCYCGPSRTNVTFVWEEGRCHYAEGSMCMARSKVGCAGGTSCISMLTLDECTSGLCFCQREFSMTTTMSTTTSSSQEGVASTSNVFPPSVHVVRPPGGGVSPATGDTSSSSEEDDFEEDVDGGEVGGRITEVKVSGTEEKVATTTRKQPQHATTPHAGGKWRTTVSSPIGTSPTPTRRQELTTAIRRLEREVESIQSLRLNDECSSIREESNYAEYRRLVKDMDCVTVENDEETLMDILSKLESIVETGTTMCNWTEHLQCSTQSKRCECRTSSEDLDGFYLLFMEEGKRCVLVENSRCLSQEYLISRKVPVLDIPCASDAKCIAEETKAECKSKIENCFCKKLPKPTEASKQKKSKPKGKTSDASSLATTLAFSILLILVAISA